MARILITVRTATGATPQFDVADLEQRLVRAARRWEDELQGALLEHCGEARASTLLARYRNAFPAGYREEHSARAAVQDIELMESLADDQALALSLYVPLEARPGRLRLSSSSAASVSVPGVTMRATARSTGPLLVAGSPTCSQMTADSPSLTSLAR